MGSRKKRSKKITGKLLGKITREDGFIESDKAKLRKREYIVSKVSVKEYGTTAFIDSCLPEYKSLLKKYFPNYWQEIITLAYCKLVHKSAMKNIEFHYLNSYLSEQFPGLSLAPKKLTELLKQLGTERLQIKDFFKEFKKDNDNIIFDGTDIISNSKKDGDNKICENQKRNI